MLTIDSGFEILSASNETDNAKRAAKTARYANEII